MAQFLTYTHAWPLFITVLPVTFDMRDVETYIAEVDELYARRQRFATLVDTTSVTALPGASERRRLADWQSATVESIRRYNVFTTLVIQSPVVRGALTAMNWIFRPPNEQLVVASFAEGFSSCVDKLRADGQPLPPAIARFSRASPPSSVEETLPAMRSGPVLVIDPTAAPRPRVRRG